MCIQWQEQVSEHYLFTTLFMLICETLLMRYVVLSALQVSCILTGYQIEKQHPFSPMKVAQ